MKQTEKIQRPGKREKEINERAGIKHQGVPLRKEWQAALDVLATKGSSEVGYPIVANPQSREFIGQAVQDLILKQKTVDQACADADKALDALIAQK